MNQPFLFPRLGKIPLCYIFEHFLWQLNYYTNSIWATSVTMLSEMGSLLALGKRKL